MAAPFQGVGVALVTLFDDHGDVLVDATAEHARSLVDLGMRHVLVCGSTGEAGSLTPDERVALIGAVRRSLPRGVPVLAGTGAASAAAAAELTVAAREAGADAILALSPPGSEQLVRYYAAVVGAAGGLPVLAYHFPAMSAPGIELEVLPSLPVAGVKDSSGDPERLAAEVDGWDGSVFVGSTRILHLARALGAAGAILGLANAEPEICLAAFDGDAAGEKALAASRRREAELGFPVGVKQLTARRFGVSPVARLERGGSPPATARIAT